MNRVSMNGTRPKAKTDLPAEPRDEIAVEAGSAPT
jgi:hypothetical protein